MKRNYRFLVQHKKITESILYFKKTQRYTQSEGYYPCRLLLTDHSIYILDMQFLYLEDWQYKSIQSLTVAEDMQLNLIIIKSDHSLSLWNLNRQFLRKFTLIYAKMCKIQLEMNKISQVEMKQVISANFIGPTVKGHKRISSI